MGIDAVVVRHGSAGVPWQVADWLGDRVAVINGGDGWHEHPTQALLDCYTIRQHFGGLDGPAHRHRRRRQAQPGGPLRRARLRRPRRRGHPRRAADAAAAQPRSAGLSRSCHDLDEVVGEVDVVGLLRMQRERMTEALVPSLREYTARYGLTAARLGRMADKAIVMHPGPMNRGVEISAEAATSDRSVILDQVRNGVAVRMAVLYLLLGSGVDLT